jgi:hypothetical protein
MTSSCRSWFVAFIVVAACGPAHKKGGVPDAATDGGTTAPDAMPLPHTLTTLEVTPTNPLIQLDLNTPGSQGFTVMGDYADGTTEDVTSQVTWTVANPAVGTMTGATLGIPSFPAANAVTSKITASLNGLDGLAQITVVAYRQTGAQQDFFFILPYTDPAGPQTKPLEFSTNIPALDVFFLMDTTCSMGGEIDNLKNNITTNIVPGVRNAVMDSDFGVGFHEDFPVDGYGGTTDQPFGLLQAITSDLNLVNTGVGKLTLGYGADGPEAGIEAIYQAATGDGLTGPAPTSVDPDHSGIGGVEFRQGTMPVIVPISDADSHRIAPDTGNCGTKSDAYAGSVAAVAHSLPQAKAALNNICARVVGIAPDNGDDCNAVPYYTALATATGSRIPPTAWDAAPGGRPMGCAASQCCTGLNGQSVAPDSDGLCPLVFAALTDGTGVNTSIVTGIQMLTRFATFDVTSTDMGVTTDTSGNPLPAGHTTADFIKMVTPANYTLPPPPPVLPTPTFDATTFHNVTPGTQVGFMVNAFNDFVMQTDHAQIFQATIQVLAGGCTPLDQRDVLILVPPQPITIARQ